MNERRGSSAALRAAASLIIGRELRLGLAQRKIVDAAEGAEMTRRALEGQWVHARFAPAIALGEARQREAPIVNECLPVTWITEVDAHATRVSPHACFDV